MISSLDSQVMPQLLNTVIIVFIYREVDLWFTRALCSVLEELWLMTDTLFSYVLEGWTQVGLVSDTPGLPVW